MDCQLLKEHLQAKLMDSTEVRPLGNGQCLVVLPFWDDAGDPISVCVSTEGGRTMVDDGGSVAGLLFSLGQHEVTTPAFKLLEALQRSHGFQLDFDEGLVQLPVNESDIYEGVAEMAKAVMSMHTVTPHMRVSRRSRRSYGPRLRSKISQRYRRMKVWDMVERNQQISGAKVERWPIDFLWTIGSNGQSRFVYVVTADLDVAEPMTKAQKVVSLSLDTQSQRQRAQTQLRVVIETGANDIDSSEASEFLRFYGESLEYELFDFSLTDESSDFYKMSENELIAQADARWKATMQANGRG